LYAKVHKFDDNVNAAQETLVYRTIVHHSIYKTMGGIPELNLNLYLNSKLLQLHENLLGISVNDVLAVF
jgi:hypothetical protein